MPKKKNDCKYFLKPTKSKVTSGKWKVNMKRYLRRIKPKQVPTKLFHTPPPYRPHTTASLISSNRLKFLLWILRLWTANIYSPKRIRVCVGWRIFIIIILAGFKSQLASEFLCFHLTDSHIKSSLLQTSQTSSSIAPTTTTTTTRHIIIAATTLCCAQYAITACSKWFAAGISFDEFSFFKFCSFFVVIAFIIVGTNNYEMLKQWNSSAELCLRLIVVNKIIPNSF